MFMKIKYIVKGLIATLVLSLAITSCENYNEELLDGIGNTREFSPIDLKATVRNQTTVELNWTTKENVDHYVAEFSADDPEFKVIYKTLNVSASELPIKVQLEGETLYSIRVKAVTTGLEDSKWSVTTANTLSEQLFLPVIPGDIQAKEATLRWVANSNATEIVVNPGNIKHAITPAEKTSGVAVITGLTAETPYTATLLNGSKKRGVQTFTTGIDIGDGILIKPTDDLSAKVTEAAPGATLVLEPGNYTVGSNEIIVNKSITIRGLRSYDLPKLHVKFTVNAGTANLSLIDLDLDGTGLTDAYAISIAGANSNYDTISITGSVIHDYDRSLIYGNAATTKLQSFKIDNSIISRVNTKAGADFIDFRTAYVASIDIKNSTFDTCSAGRDFVRVDAATGFTGTGLTTNVVIDACTLYKPSNFTSIKRILYVRFASNTSTVKNTLITDSPFGVYTNQATTTLPTYSNNYYFNAPGFMNASIAANKPDPSGTVADPQFVNAATGNFTVQNQTLKDNKIGDPRWIK
jgi:hypothetical protein